MYNVNFISVDSLKEAEKTLSSIGVHKIGIDIMKNKMINKFIRIENVEFNICNILKQEMIANGGDAAISMNISKGNMFDAKSHVILIGTISQYKKFVNKLALQPLGLKDLADKISYMINESKKDFVCKNYRLPIGKKTYIMGILNVTPDSFSDGGKYFCEEKALEHAMQLIEDGADILDIGGRSTRPGCKNISMQEEADRVLSVLDKLAGKISVPISVDTYYPTIAEHCLEMGADIINDIFGLRKFNDMKDVIKKFDAGIIIMHNQEFNCYNHLTSDIIAHLNMSISIAVKSGISKNHIIIDPGFGASYGKNSEQQIDLLKNFRDFQTIKLPLLLATSRKSFIGDYINKPVDQREEGTLATIAAGIMNGCDIVRVHDVRKTLDVVKMMDAIVRRCE